MALQATPWDKLTLDEMTAIVATANTKALHEVADRLRWLAEVVYNHRDKLSSDVGELQVSWRGRAATTFRDSVFGSAIPSMGDLFYATRSMGFPLDNAAEIIVNLQRNLEAVQQNRAEALVEMGAQPSGSGSALTGDSEAGQTPTVYKTVQVHDELGRALRVNTPEQLLAFYDRFGARLAKAAAGQLLKTMDAWQKPNAYQGLVDYPTSDKDPVSPGGPPGPGGPAKVGTPTVKAPTTDPKKPEIIRSEAQRQPTATAQPTATPTASPDAQSGPKDAESTTPPPAAGQQVPAPTVVPPPAITTPPPWIPPASVVTAPIAGSTGTNTGRGLGGGGLGATVGGVRAGSGVDSTPLNGRLAAGAGGAAATAGRGGGGGSPSAGSPGMAPMAGGGGAPGGGTAGGRQARSRRPVTIGGARIVGDDQTGQSRAVSGRPASRRRAEPPRQTEEQLTGYEIPVDEQPEQRQRGYAV